MKNVINKISIVLLSIFRKLTNKRGVFNKNNIYAK